MAGQGAKSKWLGPPSSAAPVALRRGRRRERREGCSGRRPRRPRLPCAEDGAGSGEKAAQAAVLGGPNSPHSPISDIDLTPHCPMKSNFPWRGECELDIDLCLSAFPSPYRTRTRGFAASASLILDSGTGLRRTAWIPRPINPGASSSTTNPPKRAKNKLQLLASATSGTSPPGLYLALAEAVTPGLANVTDSERLTPSRRASDVTYVKAYSLCNARP